MSVYRRNANFLADSRLKDADMKRLYIMDSTTISLCKDILLGVGRNPLDHTFIKEAQNLPKGSIITFDKGYVDYEQYEVFSKESIWYVTRLKENALYKASEEYDIPDEADSGVLKDVEIVLCYGENKKKEHRARRIAYWDSANERLFEFVTNNFDLSAEKIAIIYKKRWQIELLFKQLKQNFPLKYFLEDPEESWRAIIKENKDKYKYSLFPE